MLNRVLFSFPGQGAQRPGMLANLPGGGARLAEASEALEEDLSALDSAESLAKTRSVQLSLLIKGVSYADLLRAEGIEPDMTAGLSIGAYAAAVASGALKFSDAVKLVSVRGRVMEEAYPAGFGMMAIMGLPLPTVEAICAETKDLYVANYNAETQIVVSGSDLALRKASDAALKRGAEKCKRLRVAVPSHCPLMERVVPELKEAMEKVTLLRPRKAYLSVTTGRVLWTPTAIAEDLVYNMARRTQWREVARAAFERGVGFAVEVPPGSVLTKLTRAAAPEIASESVAETSLTDIKARFAAFKLRG